MFEILRRNIIGPDSTWFWTALQSVGVVATLFYIYRQVRIGQSASMLEALLQLETKWTTKRLAVARKAICAEYSHPTTKGKKALCPNSNALLIFFEELGLLVDLGVLDRSIVWERLSFVIDHYWQILEPRIREARAKDQDNTIYEKFEKLVMEMRKIHRKKLGGYVDRTDEQLLNYANDEVESIGHLAVSDHHQQSHT